LRWYFQRKRGQPPAETGLVVLQFLLAVMTVVVVVVMTAVVVIIIVAVVVIIVAIVMPASAGSLLQILIVQFLCRGLLDGGDTITL